MKTHCLRLKRGADLYESILEYAREKKIGACCPLSAVGCLYEWRVRDASGVDIAQGKENVEIVSLMGTAGEGGLHLHISFSGRDLRTRGGHLLPGCLINTTCELVLLELEEVRFERSEDADTGYKELEILPPPRKEEAGGQPPANCLN